MTWPLIFSPSGLADSVVAYRENIELEGALTLEDNLEIGELRGSFGRGQIGLLAHTSSVKGLTALVNLDASMVRDGEDTCVGDTVF